MLLKYGRFLYGTSLFSTKFSSFVTIACVHGKVVYNSAGNFSTKINHVISSRMIQVFLKFTFLDRKICLIQN